MMKKKLYLRATIIAIIAVCLSPGAKAQKLEYQSIGETLQYKNQISILNITDTDKLHVSTTVSASLMIENQITKSDEYLTLNVEFTDIKLDEYKREIQIEDNDKRSVGPIDLTEMDTELKSQVQKQWIQLDFAQTGSILKKLYSPRLQNVSLLNLTRLGEQFLILLPVGTVNIGYQWEDYYVPLALTMEEQLIGTKIKYTYLGKETQNGISCYKINASMALQEERATPREGGGITWVSYSGHGTLYYAEIGQYLVKSTLSSDLSFLMIVEGDGEKYVNFMRTKIDQNIDLAHIEQ